jgi:hypothetical protein
MDVFEGGTHSFGQPLEYASLQSRDKRIWKLLERRSTQHPPHSDH